MKKKSVPVLASSISAACILLLAIPDIWPYAYYQILRFAVCGAALYNGYTAYATGKKMLILFTRKTISVLPLFVHIPMIVIRKNGFSMPTIIFPLKS